METAEKEAENTRSMNICTPSRVTIRAHRANGGLQGMIHYERWFSSTYMISSLLLRDKWPAWLQMNKNRSKNPDNNKNFAGYE